MADRNESSSKSPIITTCTWDKESDCENCGIKGCLNCKWDKKLLQAFYMIALPYFAFAFVGLIFTGFITGNWLFLIAYTAFYFFFFIIYEIRILCSHCPYYAEEGRTLHCLANHGSPKIWSYHPGPMNLFEKVTFILGLVILCAGPLVPEAYTILYAFERAPNDLLVLALSVIITLATLVFSLYFLVSLRRNTCPKCVNFSCPLNTAPKSVVDAYLENNPVMRKAWEASGYKLG
ncbi:MAG: hypothetical protein ACFFD4_27830 [Candidatus Odinarchaeota archaeon]